jgi:hypothetical protein
MEISLKVLKKTKLELPYDQAKPVLDLYPEESKSAHHRDTCIPTFWRYSQWASYGVSLDAHQRMC